MSTNLAGEDIQADAPRRLFPTTVELNERQKADVEHLHSHVRTGADALVTRNPRDFDRFGKRALLRERGIWVFTPEEVVELLHKLYGWNLSAWEEG